MNRSALFITIVFLLGCITRLWNIPWGSPFFFHPDERNIATAIAQLSLTKDMNPHFFAYGGLPLYAIYYVGIITNIFQQPSSTVVPFSNAIIIGRLFSAFFSILLIGLPFLFHKWFDKKILFLSSFLFATSIGFVQYAHFATVEMWQTFFTVLIFYFSLRLLEHPTWKTIGICGILGGCLIAIKVSSIPLLLLPCMSVLLYTHRIFDNYKNKVKYIFVLFICAMVTFAICNPFVFLDSVSFFQSMHYEGGVASGSLPVFYTQGFSQTIPIIYQFLFVYPFLVNPLLTIIFIPSLFICMYTMIKHKNKIHLLLVVAFLISFLSQAFLFAKWTRYMVPTLPFFYLIIAVTFLQIKRVSSLRYGSIIFLCIISSFYCFAFFKTTYLYEDTRIQAQKWLEQYDKTATITTEVYDLGSLPFQDRFSPISVINPYDEASFAPEVSTQYIVLLSQRVLRTRLLNAKQFPKGHLFYSELFSDKKYEKLYETPCDIWCQLVYTNPLYLFSKKSQTLYSINPTLTLEETTAVFDRPTIFIFKRI